MNRLIFLGVALAGLASGCYLGQPNRPHLAVIDPSQEKRLPEWYGKHLTDLMEKMGKPTAMITNDDLSQQIFYSYEGHHYVFGTDVKGVINSAVQVD